ncbi:lysine--tRNA ligase [Candidatus Micrarchaeota archaeon]|nr:lysine--tRNA ligase [Candidatus Micrarchaeota archaeon]
MSEHKHWSEWLAERVIEEKKEPYAISGGMTTSGPAHLGTLCEFMFPSVIQKAIEKKGKKCAFYFVADILDAFDGVPVAMEQYTKELEPHFGKPLCNVPDPTGKTKSFGDHYLDEARELMKKFGVGCQLIRINEYYEEGKFDEYISFFLEHAPEARKIVEETSGKEEKKDWSPIMPICQNCGKVATTRVVSHTNEEYEYICDKDVKYTKGCGYRGKNKISDHKCKLVWRLHWPAWKQIFGTSIEGAGIDHHTQGGSEDTCREVTLNLMKKDYHIPYRYGFILFQGRKYSKSKGIGMGVTDLVKLLPVEIVKYILVKPDLEENIDINPTPENLLRTVEDFEGAGKFDQSKLNEMTRADRKRAIAYSISVGTGDNGNNNQENKVNWKSSFLDTLLYYQLYKDWGEVAKRTNDPDGVAYLRPYIEAWIEKGFVPQDYDFKYQPTNSPSENVKKFVATLNDNMDALAIHNAVFEFAKANGIEPKAFFAELYQALLGKEKGPKMGKLLSALKPSKVQKDLGI